MRKILIALTALAMPVAAQAQSVHAQRSVTVEGPRGNTVTRATTVNGWYRPAPPRGYVGVRRGYYYAPGYGYYRVAPAYSGRVWVVGGYVPQPLRTYVVVDPAVYRLRPAPVGMRWIYVGNRVALVRVDTGIIVRLGPVFW